MCSDGKGGFLLWILMRKRVALISCCFFVLQWTLGPVSMVINARSRVLHLISEHVKWQSDKAMSSGWLRMVIVLENISHLITGNQRDVDNVCGLKICSLFRSKTFKPFPKKPPENQSQLIRFRRLNACKSQLFEQVRSWCSAKENFKFSNSPL